MNCAHTFIGATFTGTIVKAAQPSGRGLLRSDLARTGNPNAQVGTATLVRGDDLLFDSVVALDVDTGKLKCTYNSRPRRVRLGLRTVPVLAQIDWQGSPRKVILWANRNGFYYVIDRTTGKFLLGKAFVKQSWNIGFDEVADDEGARPGTEPMGGPVRRAW